MDSFFVIKTIRICKIFGQKIKYLCYVGGSTYENFQISDSIFKKT